MAEKLLMKGSEAISEAAVRVGCKLFFGYPITPQNEIPEYMSKRLFEIPGGCFLQAESEVAASHMLYGAAAVGERVMTSSSSPGIALKQEGISYCAGSELPVVIVNIMRGGPGLGGIQPSQSDYWQSCKPGHGDYHNYVLAPATIQEAADLVMEAFDIADKYRNPVVILGDGLIGQMMEPVVFKDYTPQTFDKSWATTGCEGRENNIINSLYLQPDVLEQHNLEIFRKYEQMKREDVKVQELHMDDATICVAAYGTTARICKTAIEICRAEGIRVGMIRPITLFPFPEETFKARKPQLSVILDIEMSMGQMIEDVRLAVGHDLRVEFYGRVGGMVPTPSEIADQIRALAEEVA